MTIHPPHYHRQNKTWKQWIGKQGVVITSTRVHTASPQFKKHTPYSLVLVQFKNEKKLCMGASHQTFQSKDKVRCVLRKYGSTQNHELISYGIKVEKT